MSCWSCEPNKVPTASTSYRFNILSVFLTQTLWTLFLLSDIASWYQLIHKLHETNCAPTSDSLGSPPCNCLLNYSPLHRKIFNLHINSSVPGRVSPAITMKGERMEPTRATADSRPTPRHRDIIWFGKRSCCGQQLTAGVHLNIEILFGLEKWAHAGNSWQQAYT